MQLLPGFRKPRPKGYFNYDQFTKIVDELANYHFNGQFVPNFYGEPLLDKRLFEFIRYSRSKCPNSAITINTNADKLTIDRVSELLDSGVSKIFISQHDREPSSQILEIKDLIKRNPNLRQAISIKNWTSGVPLSSRGGKILDARVQLMSSSGCFRSRRATLDFEGNLIICCEDYNAEYRYGNVFDDGFLNVWKTSLNHRREIFLGNYREYICQVCSGFEPDESLPRRHIVSSIRHLNR